MRIKKQIGAVIGRTVLLLFAVQVILGICWIKGSFSHPVELVQEQGGFFYHMAAPILEKGKGIFFFLQLLLAAFAWDLLFQALHRQEMWLRCVRVLGIVTVPALLLDFYSVNPYTLSVTGIVFMMALAILYIKKELSFGKAFGACAVCQMALLFWLQEAVLFGLVPLVALAVLAWREQTRKTALLSVVVVAACLLAGALSVGCSEGTDYRSEDVLPTPVQVDGQEREERTAVEMAKDVLAYTLTPAMNLYQLAGHGNAAGTKRLQEYFLAPNPAVAWYITYLSGAVFLLGMALLGVYAVARLRENRGKRRLETVLPCILLCILCTVIILWYTIQGGGVTDMRKNMFVTGLLTGASLSMAGTLCGFGQKTGEGKNAHAQGY